MAEQVTTTDALKKLDSRLECSICLDYFKQPKLLPCFHVFCKSPCLEKLVTKDGHSLTCPTCRHIVPLTEKGVAGLQSDFHIDHLFEIRDAFHKAKDDGDTNCDNCEDVKATGYCNDCGDFLCDECESAHKRVKLSRNHTIVSLNELKDQVTSLVPIKKAIPECPKHPENTLKMYCTTCSTLICTDCTVRFHKDHNYDLVVDVIDQHKEELVSSLGPLKKKLACVNQALTDFDKRATKINDQQKEIESDICQEIDEQQVLLAKRKVELENELEMLMQLKHKDLAAQRDPVEITQMKLSSCLEFAERALQTGSDGEVLEMKVSVLNKIEQLSTDFDSLILSPKIVADVELMLSGKESLQQACRSFLEIDCGRSLSAEKSNLTGDGLKNATLREQKTIHFEPISENGHPFRGQFNLQAKLVHLKSNSTVKCEVNAQENSPYEISYCPVYRGKHELLITVNEVLVKGSPFSVAVVGLGKPIRVIQGLRKPRGVVVNSKNQLVVVDGNRTCVSVLTPEGDRIQSFGQLRNAFGVTVDQDDNVYVIEQSRCSVSKFSAEGVLLATTGKKGRGNLEFNNPLDISYNRGDKNLYVIDMGNKRIQVLTTDLTFVGNFGSRGSGDGEFMSPVCAAFDSANNIYVTDLVNRRIQVFDIDGHFLRNFSYKVNGLAQYLPFAIAIDSNDTVYVSDAIFNRMTAFTPDGVVLTTFGGPKSKEGWFDKFGGFCIDRNDSIIASDCPHNRLQIF